MNMMTVHNVIKKIKETGFGERRKRSGLSIYLPINATTEIKAMNAKNLFANKKTNRDPIIHCFNNATNRYRQVLCPTFDKRVATPHMNASCRQRRAEISQKLNILFHALLFRMKKRLVQANPNAGNSSGHICCIGFTRQRPHAGRAIAAATA